tara:strand:- start:4141 stop:4326 length:186 start_codon:yes stop_codon:yes gene_type:complete
MTKEATDWKAWATTTDGITITWDKLRQGQAKWRYDFLCRGYQWRGADLREIGYDKNSTSAV